MRPKRCNITAGEDGRRGRIDQGERVVSVDEQGTLVGFEDVKIATPPGVPAPGSEEELRRFAQLQERLAPLARRLVLDPRAAQTVVVVPSLTLDTEELAKISGVHHYEERLLCMLMLLRMPRTHLVFVTSQQIPDPIVDYYRSEERRVGKECRSRWSPYH